MKQEKRMRINRFVLDNNIWISYFITNNEQKLIDIIANNDLIVFSCKELFEEFIRVLNYPHIRKFEVNVSKAIKIMREVSVTFELQYPVKQYIPDDRNDDYLIALALQTSSGFITSGDHHILSEKSNLERKYLKLKIITKTEFENMFLKSTKGIL